MKSVRCKRVFLFLLSLITFVSKVPVISFADTRPVFSVSTSSNASPSHEFNLLSSGIARSPVLGVTNTVDWSGGRYVLLYCVNTSGSGRWVQAKTTVNSNGSLFISSLGVVPSGYKVSSVHIYYKHSSVSKFSAIPPSGKYTFNFFFSSDFTVDYSSAALHWEKTINNASSMGSQKVLSSSFIGGGDILFNTPFVIDLASVSQYYLRLTLDASYDNFAGSLYSNFTVSTGNADIVVGKDTSTEDYRDNVSAGIDNIASGVNDMSGTLNDVYVALGSLNIPIGFALTLMIALIFVGYYRFKGGN